MSDPGRAARGHERPSTSRRSKPARAEQLDQLALDYISGGVGDEVTLAANVAAWDAAARPAPRAARHVHGRHRRRRCSGATLRDAGRGGTDGDAPLRVRGGRTGDGARRGRGRDADGRVDGGEHVARGRRAAPRRARRGGSRCTCSATGGRTRALCERAARRRLRGDRRQRRRRRGHRSGGGSPAAACPAARSSGSRTSRRPTLPTTPT